MLIGKIFDLYVDVAPLEEKVGFIPVSKAICPFQSLLRACLGINAEEHGGTDVSQIASNTFAVLGVG
jgi:hypothetical protein